MAATEGIGAAIGGALHAGDVLVLEGELGAGKTCLARGVVRGAGGDPGAVRSPTFVLHQPHRGRRLTIHHVDLYRLGPGASVDVLDLDSALLAGAAVIEWGSYADLAAHAPFTVTIAPGDSDGERRLHLTGDVPDPVRRAWDGLQQDTP